MNQIEKDPARLLKFKEICDFLLAGGYFRVRISTLSPFDKVIGGLCWSITASGIAVDIDLLFQEELQIGQRIALSEKIVKALIKMKCPLPLQPHQIQGLDYDALFPIVQWCVKKVLETRRLTGDLVRALALSQFDKNYKYDELYDNNLSLLYIRNINQSNTANRKYKKATNALFNTIEAQTEATLLEYGEKSFSSNNITDQEAKDRKKSKQIGTSNRLKQFESANQIKKEEEEEEDNVKENNELKKIKELKSKLDILKKNSNISGASLLEVMKQGQDDLIQAELEYNKVNEDNIQQNNSIEIKQINIQRTHQRQVENLKKSLEINEKINQYKDDYVISKNKVKEIKQQELEKQQKILTIKTALQQLLEFEKNASSEELIILKKMKHLVYLNESLKNQEKIFKQSCKKEHENLLLQIKNIQLGNVDDVETSKLKEIERIYQQDLNKLKQIRMILAKKIKKY